MSDHEKQTRQENGPDENKKEFSRWMDIHVAAKDGYRNRMCQALESELEEKLPGHDIGNLFRFRAPGEFASKVAEIKGLPDWPSVNRRIQSGAANAALNHYAAFLGGQENGGSAAEPSLEKPASRKAGKKRLSRERINCLEGLIDLIVGPGCTEENERHLALARYMARQSYFFTPETVGRRHAAVLQMLDAGEKMPARFSTVKNPSPYCDSKHEPVILGSKAAEDFSAKDRLFYRFKEGCIPVLIDKNGNRYVAQMINKLTGWCVSQGTMASDFRYATISHLWGNAFNPLFFTSLWNIVIVPTYLNPILDKPDGLAGADGTGPDGNASDRYSGAVTFVNAYFKRLCYELYDLRGKLEDYKVRGFDIGDIVTADAGMPVRIDDIPEGHYL